VPNTFVPPLLEQTKPSLTEKEAGDLAYYGAASDESAASPEETVQNYHSAKLDLMQEGESDYINQVQKRWETEQDIHLKNSVRDIVESPTLDPALKRTVLSNYATGRYVPVGLKDKYIQKTASDVTEDTVAQRKQQDWVVQNLDQRKVDLTKKIRNKDINENITKLQSFMMAINHVYTGAANTLGIIPDSQFKEAHKEYEKHLKENPVTTSIAREIGVISTALPALLLSNPIVAVGTAAFVGGSAQGLSKYAELGTKDIKANDRLHSAAASAGLTSAEFVLPIFGAATLLMRAALNGMGNVVISELDITAQNKILEAYPELQAEQFDPKNMTVNAVLGAVIGAVFGRGKPKIEASLGKEGEYIPKDKQEPTGKTPKEGKTYEGETKLKLRSPYPAKVESSKEAQEYARLSISPDSPLALTEMANPAKASELAKAAILDTTGQFAKALGTEKGNIISHWGLPKAMHDEDIELHPEVFDEIKGMDGTAEAAFTYYTQDPNIINVTRRDEDRAAIFDIIREYRSPAVLPGNSLFSHTNFLTKGRQVFGPRTGLGYTDINDALRSISTIKYSIDSHLPEDLRGTLQIIGKEGKEYKVKDNVQGPYHIEWRYEKQYDDAAIQIMGTDSVHTILLGRDVSNVARSPFGAHLFATGRMESLEKGAIRATERQTGMEGKFLDFYESKIVKTKHGEQLRDLINEANETGIDYFSPNMISTRFPHLSAKETDNLFKTHIYWRRIQDYFYNFSNQRLREMAVQSNMQGLYDADYNSIGIVSRVATTSDLKNIRKGDLNKIRESEGEPPVEAVWNYKTNAAIPYNPDLFDKEGLRLVKMYRPIKDVGVHYDYGVIDNTMILDILPHQILPKIPGYSPRRVEENWYVSSHPPSMLVNGYRVSDPKTLRDKYHRTVAGAKDEAEANMIVKEMQEKYPDETFWARPEIQDSFGKILTGTEVHAEMVKESQRRGQRLPGAAGPARLEDPLLSVMNQVRSISRMTTFGAWLDNAKDSFVKGYSEFLVRGQFPQTKSDIIPLTGGMGREEQAKFNSALVAFKYIKDQVNFDTVGDYVWKKAAFYISDMLETPQYPGLKQALHGLTSVLRASGRQGNPLEIYPKSLTTMSFISLNLPRQWLVQPSPMFELYAIHPKSALKNFPQMLHIYMSLVGEERLPGPIGVLWSKMNRGMTSMEKGEHDRVLQNIRNSGLMQGIDMYSLFNHIVSDVNRMLVESPTKRGSRILSKVAMAIPNISRSYGFDAAEALNRIGIYIQVRSMLMERYPNENWESKENLERIAYEAQRLSGTMNRAGNLPYSTGFLSTFLQFAQISQKMTINLLQDNATILTKDERIRLAATRFVMWGGLHGLPGGAFIYWLVEMSDNETIQEYAAEIKQGIGDRILNFISNIFIDPDQNAQIAFSATMTPYSPGFLPQIDFLKQIANMFDDDPLTKTRFPAGSHTSTLLRAYSKMEGWFIAKDITDVNTFNKILLELAPLASQWNNYERGMIMFGTKQIVTANGNNIGWEYTRMEAVMKMLFGTPSYKEMNAYEIEKLHRDGERYKKEMTRTIRRQIVNIQQKTDPIEREKAGQLVNAFISILPKTHFTEQDKKEMIKDLLEGDKKASIDKKDSIIGNLYRDYDQEPTDKWKKIMRILRTYEDPKTKATVEILDGKLSTDNIFKTLEERKE
jgi:hypothetical protein